MTTMKLLDQNNIEEKLRDLPEWSADVETGLLQKEFQFKDFADAMVFVNRVGELAEEENHHPDICISYSSVVLMLTTHDAGGLTQKDFSFAKRIEEVGE